MAGPLTIVSAEETSTQIETVFTDALEVDGLLAPVEGHAVDLVPSDVDDEARQVLLAVSDIQRSDSGERQGERP